MVWYEEEGRERAAVRTLCTHHIRTGVSSSPGWRVSRSLGGVQLMMRVASAPPTCTATSGYRDGAVMSRYGTLFSILHSHRQNFCSACNSQSHGGCTNALFTGFPYQVMEGGVLARRACVVSGSESYSTVYGQHPIPDPKQGVCNPSWMGIL